MPSHWGGLRLALKCWRMWRIGKLNEPSELSIKSGRGSIVNINNRSLCTCTFNCTAVHKLTDCSCRVSGQNKTDQAYSKVVLHTWAALSKHFSFILTFFLYRKSFAPGHLIALSPWISNNKSHHLCYCIASTALSWSNLKVSFYCEKGVLRILRS